MNSKVFAAIGIASVVSVGAISVYTISYINDSQQTQNVGIPSDIQPSGESIVIKDDSRNYAAEIKDKVEDGKIQIRMTQNWTFKDGGKTSNAYLANSERNEFDLRFKISLADTGEVIMVSPDVPVGSCIENFPLSVELEPGIYDVVVAHQRVEDGIVISSVHTGMQITVK